MPNTTKVVQLHDPTTDEPISPVVNVGSLYDNNGKPVDGLVAHVVAGTEVPVPKLKDVTKELQSEVDAFISTSQAQVNDLLAGGLPVADIREIMVKDGETIRPGDVVNVEREVISGTTYGDITVGSTVQLNENGTPVDYIVVHQGNPDPSIYDESCNGTWLRRKEISELIAWDTDNVATLPNADILSYFNTYVNKFDSSIQSKIKTVKIPYGIAGTTTVNTKENGIETKVFTLSAYEVGCTTDMYAHMSSADGAKLDYYVNGDSYGATQRRLAMLNGVYKSYFTRTVDTAVDYNVIGIYYGNGLPMSNNAKSADIGILPTIIIDSSSLVGDDAVYGNEYVTKDVVAQENVENRLNTVSMVRRSSVFRLNDAYSIMLACSSSNPAAYLIDNETGKSPYSAGVSLGNSAISGIRRDDSSFNMFCLTNNVLYSYIGQLSGTSFSLSSQSTVSSSVDSNNSVSIALSETPLTTITFYGSSGLVASISGKQAQQITTDGVINNISAVSIPDDADGNKRVCVCYVANGDGNKGKTIILTIKSDLSIEFGDAVVFSSSSVSLTRCAYFDNVLYILTSNKILAYTISLDKLGEEILFNSAGDAYVDLFSYHDGVVAICSYHLSTGFGALTISWNGSNFIFGDEYSFNDYNSSFISGTAISDNKILLAYADAGNSSYNTTTILEIVDYKIGGSFISTAKDAIALETGVGGDGIKVGFGGYCACEGVIAEQTIKSDGVMAYCPINGYLKILPYQEADLYIPFISGEYIGNGTTTLTIDIGFKPAMVAIYVAYNCNEIDELSQFVIFSEQTSIRSPFVASPSYSVTINWTDTGVRLTGTSGSGSTFPNKNGSLYKYIAFKKWG